MMAVRLPWLVLMAGMVAVVLPGCREEVAEASLYERDVSGGIHNIEPVRGERGPLRFHMDGEVMKCSDCHDEFTGEMEKEALEDVHSVIKFDHGRNVLCLNCHHPQKTDSFVNFGGEEIPGDQPVMLCAKCHGPHYREWTHGVHGRVNGYWDGRPEAKKLTCIQCHDPHRPLFQPMKPEAPPVLTRFDLKGAKEGGHSDE